jgi:membrane protease YdiL (CAAX protease family)
MAMNVTDVSPVRIDQPSYVVAIDWTFELITLICFLRVATYVMQQARQKTLINSVRSPLPFPISPAVGWLFTASILLLLFAQSAFYMLLALGGIWVFLTAEQRSADYQFGLGRLPAFDVVRWGLIVCAAVLFLEIPLSNVVDRMMTWLQVPHPPQQNVELFRQLSKPGDIAKFLFGAVIISPFIEELFFRGFLLSFLKRFTLVWPAIILSAGVFAFAHENLGSVLQLWLLGIALGVAYEHTGSLLLPMAIHSCFNFVEAISLLIEKCSS